MPQFNIKIGILVMLLVSFYSARKTSTIESRLENNSLCTPGCVAEESCIPPPEFCDPAQSECFCPSNCFPNCGVLFINPCDTHLCEAPTLGTYPSNCIYIFDTRYLKRYRLFVFVIYPRCLSNRVALPRMSRERTWHSPVPFSVLAVSCLFSSRRRTPRGSQCA